MARNVDPQAALAVLVACDPAIVDTDHALAHLGRVRDVRGWLDAFEARLTNRIDELHTAGAVSAPVEDLHSRCQGVSPREGKRRKRRAEAVKDAPAFGEALASGEIAAEHTDALANATFTLDADTKTKLLEGEARLVEFATHSTPEQFGRHCRNEIDRIRRDLGVERARRQRERMCLTKKIDPVTQMYVIHAELDADTGTKVFKALDTEIATLVKQAGDRTTDRGRVGAEALANLVSGGHQAKHPAIAEVSLLVDHHTLREGRHEHTVCEYGDGTQISLEAAQRILCDATIIPIIVDQHGNVLNMGRQQRLANRHQRRALRAMYRTCMIGDCDVPFDQCEIHHLQPWENDGPTDLRNLGPVCSRHHHLLHEGGWALHLAPDRTLTVAYPDGTILTARPDVPPRGALRTTPTADRQRRTGYQTEPALPA